MGDGVKSAGDKPRYYAYSTIKAPDKGEVGGSSPPRPTIQIQCLCGHSRFCLSPEFPAKPFVNDLSTSGIAICRPRRHRRHHDLARGFTDCLNFLLTATSPRHSQNGKNINVHSRHIGLWKSSLQNQRSQIRGITVIDTCVIWTIVRLIRWDGYPAGDRLCWSSSGNGAPLRKT